MRTLAIVSAATTAAALAATPAAANGDHREKCFDKGSLRYVDCFPPAPAPLPEPLPSTPEPEQAGFYIGLKGGIVFVQDTEFDINTGAVEVENEYDAGYAIGGVFGVDLGEVAPRLSLRTDFEVGYQSSGVEQHRALGAPQPASEGDTDVLYGFINFYGDVALLRDLDLVLGGGFGVGKVDFEEHGAGGVVLMDDSELAFAYHLDAGFGYDLDRHWTLATTYRYSSFLNADIDFAAAGGPSDGDPDVDSHQLLGELRYRF